CIRAHGGAAVKTVGEGLVASFAETVPAVRAALELAPALAANDLTRGLSLRTGVHRGPALVATINDHLDYFGTTPRVAAALPRLPAAGAVVLSPSVASDPGVAALLEAQQRALATVPAHLPGLKEGFVQRIEPPPTGHGSRPDTNGSGRLI